MTDTPTPEKNAHAITGAFGFSGKYLAQRLLDRGQRVVTLTNSPNRPNPFGGRVEARPLAFGDVNALAASLADVKVLYNTYWVRFNHPLFNHADGLRNTLTLFEAAKKAGVERVVHVSITGADPASPHEYFSAKGHLEKALAAFGLGYSIVRPAVLFGPEDILINNLAWALRRFPVFGLFGDGQYPIRPVYVDDLAALMADEGQKSDNSTVNALGPEEFTFRELVERICAAVGKNPRLIAMRPDVALKIGRAIGWLVDDVLITREEMEALMQGLLTVPGAPATGQTRLSDWLEEHKRDLGRVYHGELDRRKDRGRAY